MSTLPPLPSRPLRKAQNGFARWARRGWLGSIAGLALFLALPAANAGDTLSNVVASCAAAARRGGTTAALKILAAAEQEAQTNSADLCRLTKCYCDLMHDERSIDMQKKLATLALADALRAEQADPGSATAHLCVAICYVKNFPWAPNATKVAWSKAIKQECERAIALEPRADVGYYLLGRWEFGVANMNFFIKGLARIIYGGLPAASNDEAIRDFQKAIALAPRRIIHHAELARVYEVMGENRLAAAELKTCAALAPVDRDDADAQTDAAQRLAALEHTHPPK